MTTKQITIRPPEPWEVARADYRRQQAHREAIWICAIVAAACLGLIGMAFGPWSAVWMG